MASLEWSGINAPETMSDGRGESKGRTDMNRFEIPGNFRVRMIDMITDFAIVRITVNRMDPFQR